MAEKIKLKSVFTSEDTYTVLQLILKMIKIIDANDDITQADIDELKKQVSDILNSKLLDYIHVNETSGRTIIGNSLEVDGSDFLLGGRDMRMNHFGDAEGSVTNVQHQNAQGVFETLMEIRDKSIALKPNAVMVADKMFRINYHKEGVWDTVDLEIKSASGTYITVLRLRKNDEDVFQVQLVGDGILITNREVANMLTAYSTAKYQHTVHMTTYTDTNCQLNIAFTAMSSKSTPVDSYQDLNSLFGGCNLSVSGEIKYYSALVPVYLDLHGGTIATDKIYAITSGSAGAYQQPTLSSFPSIVYTDDVCIPK